MNAKDKLFYTIHLADNALIIGHRMSEWCGHGPILEQDIAITNMSLDHLGQARSLYQYAADQFNALPEDDKKGLFSSVVLDEKIAKGEAFDEDDLPYLRDGWDYKNVLLVEQPNEDWAYTVVRSFFYDTYSYLLYTELLKSKDERLAAIAEKSLKEVKYHLKWSSEWIIRLGDGTEESHKKVQTALDDLWTYSGEMFKSATYEDEVFKSGIGTNQSNIATQWQGKVAEILAEATLSKPDISWMQDGGKVGNHTENLGYILAELQYIQRAYPNMEW